MMLLRPHLQVKVAEQVTAAGSGVKCHACMSRMSMSCPPPEEDTKTVSQNEVHQSVEEPMRNWNQIRFSSNRIQRCCWNLRPSIDEPPERNLNGT